MFQSERHSAGDELQVTCEDPVFDAVSQWLSEDPDARGPEFERIVPHIRLPYCTSAYLCHVVQQTPSMRAEACSHLVDEARDFQLQPEHQTQVRVVWDTPSVVKSEHQS